MIVWLFEIMIDWWLKNYWFIDLLFEKTIDEMNEWMNEFDIAKGCYTNTVDQIENCSNTAESRWDQVSNFE